MRRGFYSGNSPSIKRMPQKNRTLKGVLGGLLGLVGLSAVAGVLATAAVTPAIAIAGVSGKWYRRVLPTQWVADHWR